MKCIFPEPARDSNLTAKWHFDDSCRERKKVLLTFASRSASLLSGYGAASLDNNPNYGHTPSHHPAQLSSLPFKHEDPLSPPSNIGTESTSTPAFTEFNCRPGGACHVTARLHLSNPSPCHVTAEPLLGFLSFLPTSVGRHVGEGEHR